MLFEVHKFDDGGVARLGNVGVVCVAQVCCSNQCFLFGNFGVVQ